MLTTARYRALCDALLAVALGLQIGACIGRPILAMIYLITSLIFTMTAAIALADRR